MSDLIYVEAYIRIRNGRIQHVRGHFRRWPNRPLLALAGLPTVA